MKDRYYSIAGITVKIRMEGEIGMLSAFQCREAEPEITVEIYQENQEILCWYGIEYWQRRAERPHLFLSKASPAVRLTASGDWSHMVIEGAAAGDTGVMEVFLAGFYSWLSLRGGVVGHASVISWQKEAVIFTAASGTGKTTQARLWEKYKEAEILNGDKVILECSPQMCWAWGSPWRGSSPYGLNQRAPLKAVVALEQAKENRIRRLDSAEAGRYVLPHIFFPLWNGECTEAVMRAMDQILSRTPVFLLSCLPDREAVEAACRAIWGEKR